MQLLAGILENGGDPACILLQVNQLQPTAELHRWPLADLLTQGPLQIRLIESHQTRMPIDAAGGIGAGEGNPRAADDRDAPEGG